MDNSPHVLIVIRNVQDDYTSDYANTLLSRGYKIKYASPEENPVIELQQNPPLAACFQFDYPDTRGLASLRLAKQEAPSVPLLMITQAHSEQLAVWAFRTRVWDYFVQPVDTSRLLQVLETLRDIYQGNQSDTRSRALLDHSNPIPPEARLPSASTREQQKLLDRTLAYLDANLHSRIVQADVAEICGLSPFQFSRLFKRLTKVTFQEYLLTRRVDEAKRLLANPKVSVTDICFTVGFHDLSYFTRIFKRYVGLSPSRYRLSLECPTQQSEEPVEVPMTPLWAGTPGKTAVDVNLRILQLVPSDDRPSLQPVQI